MFKLIKNKEDWKEYASIQESRTFPNPAKHVNIPKEFPCLVTTIMQPSSNGFNLIHKCVFKSDAKQLLSIKK
jgi:hypothetical protein